jgi:hypothetical protein
MPAFAPSPQPPVFTLERACARRAELAAVLREMLLRGLALHQLRRPVADFIGRADEIEKLAAALRSGQHAAISGISGLGGIGKMELGILVAERLKPDYPDAQLFVPLRGTDPTPRDAGDALAALHDAVGRVAPGEISWW